MHLAVPEEGAALGHVAALRLGTISAWKKRYGRLGVVEVRDEGGDDLV